MTDSVNQSPSVGAIQIPSRLKEDLQCARVSMVVYCDPALKAAMMDLKERTGHSLSALGEMAFQVLISNAEGVVPGLYVKPYVAPTDPNYPKGGS